MDSAGKRTPQKSKAGWGWLFMNRSGMQKKIDLKYMMCLWQLIFGDFGVII